MDLTHISENNELLYSLLVSTWEALVELGCRYPRYVRITEPELVWRRWKSEKASYIFVRLRCIYTDRYRYCYLPYLLNAHLRLNISSRSNRRIFSLPRLPTATHLKVLHPDSSVVIDMVIIISSQYTILELHNNHSSSA